MINARKVVSGFAALGLAAVLAAPAKADLEAVASKSQPELARTVKSLKDSVKKAVESRVKLVRGEENRCPTGTHWDGTTDETGPRCVSDHPYSVTCEIVGWRRVVDENGEYLKPILGECTPKGGFAGTNPFPNQPQAP